MKPTKTKLKPKIKNTEYEWLNKQKVKDTSGNPNSVPVGLEGLSQNEEFTIAKTTQWIIKHCRFMNGSIMTS